MDLLPLRLLDFPSEIVLLVIEQLLGDSQALCNFTLLCKYARRLSLPLLLRTVDLSSHNDGRQSQYEDELRPEIYADFSDDYRPENLVRRQRAFLRLITDRSNLALHVQSFTWTLIWKDFGDEDLATIDFELWSVFSRLVNVHRLDLASLHQIAEEPFIRKNPPRLFPAVTNLRLLGWMHRGLVDAIINSIDLGALCTLSLDYLQDEGAFPDGTPMSEEVAKANCRSVSNVLPSTDGNTINEDLLERQRNGRACIFPGPMWTIFRTLSLHQCTSIQKLLLRIVPFDLTTDQRSYNALFLEVAKFLSTIRRTLISLTIVFAESPVLYDSTRVGTARNHRITLRRCVAMFANSFLRRLLEALNDSEFPALATADFEGFHLLQAAEARDLGGSALNTTREISERRNSKISWQAATERIKTDYRPVFNGYDFHLEEAKMQQYRTIFQQS